MTKFTIETNVDFNAQEINHVQEIVIGLIRSGGLIGVKGGKTIIHFNELGDFMGIELDYWPWRRRKQ